MADRPMEIEALVQRGYMLTNLEARRLLDRVRDLETALRERNEVLERVSAPDPLADPEIERNYFAALARAALAPAEER